ncbi:hypothetical protein INR49_003280 [Caranx melampygus]|nr:hypothetical protein INR49_003280 [Caranx melampygus]
MNNRGPWGLWDQSESPQGTKHPLTGSGGLKVIFMSELRMSLQSLMVAVVMVLLLLSPCPGTAAPPGEPDEDAFDYDLNSEDWENLDVNIYGDSYDYDDLDQEIEVGTIAPDIPSPDYQPTDQHYEDEEEPCPPCLQLLAPWTSRNQGSLVQRLVWVGMPTCLLCVCIGGSVYCEDTNLDQIPPLPKDTTHFYGRFNKIRHVKNTDFLNLKKLQSIDLTGNQISGMDEDVFIP